METLTDQPKTETKPKLLKLDLGCGGRAAEGFIGVDGSKESGAEIIHNLIVTPWPFESDSVDEVVSNHFLEHLTGEERLIFMDELWRVMKEGAKATIIVPYYASMRAVQDPTHQWPPLCEASFLYFNKKWREDNKLTHYLGKCDFDFNYGFGLYPDVALKSAEVQAFQIAHYLNSATDLIVTLTKRA